MMPPEVYLARLAELRGQLDRAYTRHQTVTAWTQLLDVLLNALAAHSSTDYTQFFEMATSKTKIPTVALTGNPAPKRPASRLPLDVSPAEDVAKGRRAWPRVQAVLPAPVARSYSAAVQAVGGLATPNKSEYK